MAVLDWLLAGDPALAWQAMRDLTDAAPEAIAAVRARVPYEGMGAAIFARQEADGVWRVGETPDWVPTLYTMLSLRALGVDPRDDAVRAAVTRVGAGFRWHESLGGKLFFSGETEPCINGGTLALGAYFGVPEAPLVARLLSEQLADGGWNCAAPPSVRSSFHSTIAVLEGLLEYERAVGATPQITAARQRGETYLLERRLRRRLSTGEVVSPAFSDFAFPPRCYYDLLRGLDYLREAGVTPDGRVEEAVQIVKSKCQLDGRWRLDAVHEAAIDIAGREVVGEPSRWNTLRALRVLRWYEGR